MSRKQGEVDSHPTKFFKGHKYFCKALKKWGKVRNLICLYCEVIDDVEHHLRKCYFLGGVSTLPVVDAKDGGENWYSMTEYAWTTFKKMKEVGFLTYETVFHNLKLGSIKIVLSRLHVTD